MKALQTIGKGVQGAFQLLEDIITLVGAVLVLAWLVAGAGALVGVLVQSAGAA